MLFYQKYSKILTSSLSDYIEFYDIGNPYIYIYSTRKECLKKCISKNEIII